MLDDLLSLADAPINHVGEFAQRYGVLWRCWRRLQLADELSVLVEELLWLIAAEPSPTLTPWGLLAAF